MAFVLHNDGNTNYARLTCLVMKEGTYRIRENLLTHLIDGMSMPQALATYKNKLEGLRKRNIISEVQFQAIYPPDSVEPRYEEIDMTLLIVLARNLSRGKNHVNWNHHPKDTDIKWQHDALRIKEARNKLFHLGAPELSHVQYQSMWYEVVGALTRLGTPGETIQEYSTRDLDPTQTKMCMLQVREQVLEEMHGMYIMEAKRRRQLCFIIIAFVLVAIMLSVAIVVPLIIFLRPGIPCDRYLKYIPRDEGVLQYEPRSGWGAAPPLDPLTHLKIPVPIVGIFHSALIHKCDRTVECCDSVKYIQQAHFDNGWSDIGYTFLIGGDGVIYEGRGWDYVPASAKGWNSKLISLCFMGNFQYELPSSVALLAAKTFIHYLVDMEKLHQNYTLYGHCEMSPDFPDSPGPKLYEEIKKWPHWRPRKGSNCAGDNTTFPSLPQFMNVPQVDTPSSGKL